MERSRAIQAATRRAIEVPLRVMEVSLSAMYVVKAMASEGNPNSVTDAGVGALASRSAVMGAHLNVKVNCGSIKDADFKADVLSRAAAIEEKAVAMEAEILQIVSEKL